jgi:modulator of FtsH protease
LFVAVSINVARILEYAGLPERALATVLLLLVVVVVSRLGLIPQSRVALGVELLAVALGFVIVIAALLRGRARESLRYVVSRQVTIAVGIVPLLVGAVSVLAEAGGGLYWIAAGMIIGIAGAVANAWVFLVEILR